MLDCQQSPIYCNTVCLSTSTKAHSCKTGSDFFQTEENWFLYPTKLEFFKSTIMIFLPADQQKKRLNFYDCIHPMIVVSRVFGLVPFKFKLNANGEPESTSVSSMDIVRFVGSLTVNLLVSYLVQYSSRSKRSFECTILILMYHFFRFFSYLNLLLLINLDMMNRNRVLEMLQDFVSFDKNVNLICTEFRDLWKFTRPHSFQQIESLGVIINFDGIRRQALWSSILWTGIVTLMVSVRYIHFKFVFAVNSLYDDCMFALYYFTCGLQSCTYMCVVVQHLFYIKSLSQRYVDIDNLIRWIIFAIQAVGKLTFIFWNSKRFLGSHNETETTIIELGSKAFDAKYFIKRVGQLHEKLCDIMTNVNFCYSFQVWFWIFTRIPFVVKKLIKIDIFLLQMLMDVTTTFVYSLFTIFTLYRHFALANEIEFSSYTAISYSNWSMFHLSVLISIIYSDSRVARMVRLFVLFGLSQYYNNLFKN